MLPFETNDLPEEDEEDIDPFAELEVATSAPAARGADTLSALEDDDDPLAAFEDDFESPEEIVISFDDEEAPEPEAAAPAPQNSAESTYRLLLETVWVDDILDPSEVELLARKRGELGISFERHLQLVRDIIGG